MQRVNILYTNHMTEKEREFVSLLLADQGNRKSKEAAKNPAPVAPKITDDKITNITNASEHEDELERWKRAMTGSSTPVHDGPCPPGCMGDHSAERAIFEKTTAEKLRAVKLLKAEGNELFNNSEFAQSCLSYRKGLIFLDYTFPDTETEEDEFKSLEVVLCLNLAAAKEKQNLFTESLHFAQRAAKNDPQNPKAWFRAGLARLGLAEYNAAEEALNRAKSLAPGDALILQALRTLAERKAEYAKREKAMAKKIVS